MISGALPAGLTLSTDGVIRGTPMAVPGTYAVRVRVTDAVGAYAEAPVTVTITETALAFGGASVSTTVNVPFSYALSASGGVGAYTWAAAGSLPSGVTLSANGVINGTLGTAGTYPVAVRVTDGRGTSVLGNITITVEEPE